MKKMTRQERIKVQINIQAQIHAVDPALMVSITTEMTMFYNALNQFLMQHFNYKSAPGYISPDSIIFDASRKKFRLYTRLKSQAKLGGTKNLEIAQIGFEDQRQGHGTALLKFIAEIADKFALEKIIIEGTNINSSVFAESMGFSPLDEENWVAEVEQLKQHLSKISI